MRRKMSHRERVLTAFNHAEPDRVPFDLGSTHVTTMHREPYERLKKRLGISGETDICHKMLQAVHIDEEILEFLDVDTRGVFLGRPERWSDIELDPETYVDEWGIMRRKPVYGYYYDQVGKPPLDVEEFSYDNLERMKVPDPDDPGRYNRLLDRIRFIKSRGDYAIVFNLGASFVHQAQYMRGMENWLADTVLSPDLAGALLDRMLDGYYLPVARRALEIVGKSIDVVQIGDDLGTQDSLLCSPETYRSIIKPRQKRLIEVIRQYTEARIFFHTCGAVEPLIGDFIEIGIDILNPIQVLARGMEPAVLKAKYGQRLVFWGAVDAQRLLPYGSPAEVRKEVVRLTDTLGKGGGYIVSSVNNIQPGVPVDNIIAMRDAVRLTQGGGSC